jgi:hypothetical protein
VIIKSKYQSNQVIFPNALKKPKEIDNTQGPAKSRLFKQNNALKITEEPYINYNNSLSLFEPSPHKL